ncbi:MAG: LPS export ABC transporter permease LptG [Pseudomonadales bacterium]|nr:LPS export ABC transporter permease LptG [Pseudomonadales bacterium]
MFSIIDRYLFKQLIGAMFLVLLVIGGLDFVFAFLAELEDVSDHYALPQIGLYMLGILPRRIYELLPFCCLIGCLIGLGGLASSHELTAIRSAGASMVRLVKMVLQPTLVLIIGGFVLGEYIAPVMEKNAQSQRAIAKGKMSSGASRYGFWQHEKEQFLHVLAVQPNGELNTITRYQLDESRQVQSISIAQSARYEDEQWTLYDIATTTFSEDQVRYSETASQPWSTELTPDTVSLVIMDPDRLSISALYRYTQYLAQQGVNTAEYDLAFWKKTLQPVSIIALIVLGISFVFGPLREVNIGLRILSGVIIGLIFMIAQNLLGPASGVFGFPPLIAVLIPPVIALAIGLRVLSKVR